jgi:hypothetical protein
MDLDSFASVFGKHGEAGLDLSILVRRYREEMGTTISDRRRLRSHFLTMVERVFPEEVDQVEKRLGTRRRWPREAGDAGRCYAGPSVP